ncbi:MAG: CpaF family protein [bacterium]|jgi:pilus assembly protein CpaF
MQSLYQRIQAKEKALKEKEIEEARLEKEKSKLNPAREVKLGKIPTSNEQQKELKSKIQQKLIDEVDSSLLAKSVLTDEEKNEIKKKLHDLIQEEESVSPLERDQLVNSLMAEFIGFGRLEPLLHDPEITEIMINSPQQIYVEKQGKLTLTDLQYEDNRQVMNLIEKIVAPLGRRIDESSPMVDARLPDGSRVNAIIPPLALKGPCVTIRKFSQDPYQIDDLIRFGTMDDAMAAFLEACVKARLNIIVSGGTGSGKTTTLNVLSSFIPSDERIVTIEDAAELQLHQEHVVSLETRPVNIEGRGEISIRQLVRNSLRMRPDRIVVGEVRSGEALDMLQAMNTGHDGSLTTGHANSPRDMLSRLETMTMMAGMELPVRAIREQIASAIDLIVQQTRMRDGTRKITHITELQGMEGDVIVLQDIFLFKQRGVTGEGKIFGEFKPVGVRPRCYEKIVTGGIDFPASVFSDLAI